jgi:hypothetical protein
VGAALGVALLRRGGCGVEHSAPGGAFSACWNAAWFSGDTALAKDVEEATRYAASSALRHLSASALSTSAIAVYVSRRAPLLFLKAKRKRAYDAGGFCVRCSIFLGVYTFYSFCLSFAYLHFAAERFVL